MSLPDGPHPPRGTAAPTTEPKLNGSSTIAAATNGTLVARPAAERCDHCGAPVEGAQRYCVQCGTSQRRADDPTARWFAAARRAKIAPAAAVGIAPAAGRTVPAGVAAVLIALLPLAAGIGVLVGRGSDDSGKAVVDALKAVSANGGLVASGGTAAVAATTPDGSAAAAADVADDTSGDAKTTKKVGDIEVTNEQAPVLATGPTGSARKLTGTKPTEKDVAESKKALGQIESKKGADYVEQQKDLPDTIVVP